MKNELDIMRDLAHRFAPGHIEYMLTGLFAMNYYAQPRMTRAIDVVVALKPQDVDTISNLFNADYYVAREAITRAITHESVFNLIHHETVIKVDCIVRKNDTYRRLECERRVRVPIQDFAI